MQDFVHQPFRLLWKPSWIEFGFGVGNGLLIVRNPNEYFFLIIPAPQFLCQGLAGPRLLSSRLQVSGLGCFLEVPWARDYCAEGSAYSV